MIRKIWISLALLVGGVAAALAQTSPGNVGNGQIGANYGAGYVANNWMASGSTSCPAWLSTAELYLNTSGGPTGDLLQIYDGANCVTIGTLNATAHSFTVPVAAGGTGANSAGATAANNIGALAEANNLSDVANAGTARTNLAVLGIANNLSDLNSASTARTNLGVPAIIASGTLALATGAISSGTCTSAQTATANGVATTDAIIASFNADPTGTTGYIPSTSGMLTIILYPTLNTVNAKVCNNTGSSITPGGAVTLNWRVVR